jgi:hypothetical protein
LTDGPLGDQPGIYYNLVEGDEVYISHLCYGLTTASDSCTYELVRTTAVNGAGTVTAVSLERHIATGTGPRGRQDEDLIISPVLGPFRYADGIRSITMRVNANDADASINVAWHGFIINNG